MKTADRLVGYVYSLDTNNKELMDKIQSPEFQKYLSSDTVKHLDEDVVLVPYNSRAFDDKDYKDKITLIEVNGQYSLVYVHDLMKNTVALDNELHMVNSVNEMFKLSSYVPFGVKHSLQSGYKALFGEYLDRVSSINMEYLVFNFKERS